MEKHNIIREKVSDSVYRFTIPECIQQAVIEQNDATDGQTFVFDSKYSTGAVDFPTVTLTYTTGDNGNGETPEKPENPDPDNGNGGNGNGETPEKPENPDPENPDNGNGDNGDNNNGDAESRKQKRQKRKGKPDRNGGDTEKPEPETRQW